MATRDGRGQWVLRAGLPQWAEPPLEEPVEETEAPASACGALATAKAFADASAERDPEALLEALAEAAVLHVPSLSGASAPSAEFRRHSGAAAIRDWYLADTRTHDVATCELLGQAHGALPRIASARVARSDGAIDWLQLENGADGWRVRHVLRDREAAEAEESVDRELRAACHDYVEAFYSTDPGRLAGCVRADLAKYGFESGAADSGAVMSRLDAERIASVAFAGGRPQPALEAAVVLARGSGSAMVRLAAAWGIDDLTLVKTPEGWRIAQALWQSWPLEVGVTLPGIDPAQADSQTCRFSGKPIAADSLTLYRGRVVGFCNPGCRDKFAAAPLEYGKRR
jgi:hypothetical protein